MATDDTELHIRAAREERLATIEEFHKKRYMVVGDLAVKAVEQAIEAAASLEGKHFHVIPRSAHAQRMSWLKEKFPHLSRTSTSFGERTELWATKGWTAKGPNERSERWSG
jgi:hypothetical protein